ncbi:hypothetical protein KSS87_002271 [Heliosperma pusillum]|nr:hypothetical protein KSS87_002271 [Heliosperma pusillum]
MRFCKVYHRIPFLTLSSTHQCHHLRPSNLSTPSFLSPSPFIFPPTINSSRHFRTVSSVSRKPFGNKMSSSSSNSRIHNLVPIEAVSAENSSTAATGFNGSASNFTYDEDDLSAGSGYQLPPPEIRDIVDAPPLPSLSFSPHKDKILFLKRRSLTPLADLARPEEKLAGVRIDGKCNTRSRMSFYTGIGIHQLMGDGTLGPEKMIQGLPDGARINFVNWSTDGQHIAFTVRVEEFPQTSFSIALTSSALFGGVLVQDDGSSSRLRLWAANVATGLAKPLFQSADVYVNSIFDKYVFFLT